MDQPVSQFQDLGPYGTPGRTGVVLAAKNPYVQTPDSPTTATPQEQPKQAGYFDALPYHTWLGKQKEPWNISNEDLSGKKYDEYMDGPGTTMIARALARQNPKMAAKNLDDRVKKEVDALKLQNRSEVEQNLPQLKAHLSGLKPKDAPGQVAQGQNSGVGGDIMGDAQRIGSTALRTLGMAAGGLARYNPFTAVGRLVAPKATEQAIQDAEGVAFGGIQTLKKSEDALPKDSTSTDTTSKVARFVADVIPAILTGGIGALSKAQDVLDNNGTLTEAEKVLAKQAIINEIGLASSGVGGSVVKRATVGGGTSLALGEAERRAENMGKPANEQIPFDPLSAALNVGAGAAGALASGKKGAFSREPGATPPAASAAGALDADALAAATQGDKGNIGAANLTPSMHEQIADATNPAELQAVHDKNIESVSPEQRQAFTDKFNEAAKAIHDDNTFQAKPQTAQPAPVQGEVTPGSTTSNAPANATPVAQEGTGQDQFAFAGVQPKAQTPVEQPLPRSLEKSAPKFGATRLSFDSDVEKALYIVGNKNALSKADPRFIDYLKAHFPGVSSDGIRALAARVKDSVKAEARANPDAEIVNVPKLGVFDKFHADAAAKVKAAQEAAAPEPQQAPQAPQTPQGLVERRKAIDDALRPHIERRMAKPRANTDATDVTLTPLKEAPVKGSVESMLSEPVKAPIIGARGRQVASTNLKFASETDKLGYLHANSKGETQTAIAEQLKLRGIKDPAAFAEQVQAQVKAKTKGNSLKSVPAETHVGVIVPHVMRGIPIPPKGGKTGPKAPPR